VVAGATACGSAALQAGRSAICRHYWPLALIAALFVPALPPGGAGSRPSWSDGGVVDWITRNGNADDDRNEGEWALLT